METTGQSEHDGSEFLVINEVDLSPDSWPRRSQDHHIYASGEILTENRPGIDSRFTTEERETRPRIERSAVSTGIS